MDEHSFLNARLTAFFFFAQKKKEKAREFELRLKEGRNVCV
jgi:hypothetical protein